MLYHPDASLYINNVTNGLKPINSAYPPYYYACVNLRNSMNIIIRVKCKVTEGFSIQSLPFVDYNKDDEINFTYIEEVNGSYICLYYMDELPTENTLYETSFPRLVNSAGIETSCSVYPNESITNKSFKGIIFKVEERYSILKEEIKYLNENLTTEFKLYQTVGSMDNSINSKSYDSYTYYVYNKQKYDVDIKQYKHLAYLNTSMELYTFKDYVDNCSDLNYVARIDVSDQSTKIFGLSINDSFDEVLLVLSNIGLVRVDDNNDNSSLKFKSPNDAFYVYFEYSNSLSKFTSFSVYSELNFDYK